MPTISISKAYKSGEILLESDLDLILSDIEDFINTEKLDGDNVQTAGIIGTQSLESSSVTQEKLSSAAVRSTHIVNEAVTADKLNADVAGEAIELNNDNAVSVKVDDATIEVASDAIRLKDNGITQSLLAVPAVKTEVESVNINSSPASWTKIAGSDVSIVTSGRPVLVGMNAKTAAFNSAPRISEVEGMEQWAIELGSDTGYPGRYFTIFTTSGKYYIFASNASDPWDDDPHPSGYDGGIFWQYLASGTRASNLAAAINGSNYLEELSATASGNYVFITQTTYGDTLDPYNNTINGTFNITAAKPNQNTHRWFQLELRRNGSPVTRVTTGFDVTSTLLTLPSTQISHLDNPPAGEHTYSLWAKVEYSSQTVGPITLPGNSIISEGPLLAVEI